MGDEHDDGSLLFTGIRQIGVRSAMARARGEDGYGAGGVSGSSSSSDCSR